MQSIYQSAFYLWCTELIAPQGPLCYPTSATGKLWTVVCSQTGFRQLFLLYLTHVT